MNDGAIGRGCHLFESYHVALQVSLGEFGFDALPDFLTRRASTFVEGNDGDLNHLKVGVAQLGGGFTLALA